MSAGDLHEAADALRAATIDNHRAYRSLIEELDAINWYTQRVDAAADPSLAALLAHNRDEEKEHAAMVLEWLRRRDPVLDRHLREYLFSEGAITEHEASVEHAGGTETAASTATPSGLGIGGSRPQPSAAQAPAEAAAAGLGIASLRSRSG
jgi:uncharacterized protein